MRVCARTQVVRWAHTRKLGAHTNFPLKTVSTHASYMSFYIQMSAGKMLHTGNFVRTQSLKIRGNIGAGEPMSRPVRDANSGIPVKLTYPHPLGGSSVKSIRRTWLGALLCWRQLNSTYVITCYHSLIRIVSFCVRSSLIIKTKILLF